MSRGKTILLKLKVCDACTGNNSHSLWICPLLLLRSSFWWWRSDSRKGTKASFEKTGPYTQRTVLSYNITLGFHQFLRLSQADNFVILFPQLSHVFAGGNTWEGHVNGLQFSGSTVSSLFSTAFLGYIFPGEMAFSISVAKKLVVLRNKPVAFCLRLRSTHHEMAVNSAVNILYISPLIKAAF